MENMIDITGADLRELVKAAYDVSQPQGAGFIHYTPGPLSDEEADEIIQRSKGGNEAVYMDYVKGRSVKLGVITKDGRLYIHDRWYDHTPGQLASLLKRITPSGETK